MKAQCSANPDYSSPKTSRWLSGDPAMGEYFPSAPINDEAKKRNKNLPGQGGVFNYVNLHVYHYAGNNPVKYVDPDGEYFGVDVINSIREGISIGKLVNNIYSDLEKPEARTVDGIGKINQKIRNEIPDMINNARGIIENIIRSPFEHGIIAVLVTGLFLLDIKYSWYKKAIPKEIDIFGLAYKSNHNIGTNGVLNIRFGFSGSQETVSMTNESTFTFNFSLRNNMQIKIDSNVNFFISTRKIAFNFTRIDLLFTFSFLERINHERH